MSSFLFVLREAYGIDDTEEKVLRLIKIDTKACAKVLSNEHALDETSLLSKVRDVYDRYGVEFQKPIEGARSICEKVLEVGGVNALVTHRDKASTESFLKIYDFSKYFSCVVTRDDGFKLKPSPESFQHAIELLSLDKIVTCGVGDREVDVGAANAAKISSYFFSSQGDRCPTAKFNIRALAELESALSQKGQ